MFCVQQHELLEPTRFPQRYNKLKKYASEMAQEIIKDPEEFNNKKGLLLIP